MRLVWNEEWYEKLAAARGSVANAIRKWPSLARTIATAEVQALYAADARDLNARALHEHYERWSCEGDSAAQWWPRGGYRSLIEKLGRGLSGRVHRADPVTRIECVAKGGPVRIVTRDKRHFEAARVIVAVPLGVLKASDITFAPRLSRAKRAAIWGIGMGDVVKVVVRCRPFWGGYRFISSEQEIPVWWPLPKRRDDRGVIIGWATGPAAKKLRRLGTGEIKRRAVSSLCGIFPEVPAVASEDIFVVDWSRQKFTKGAYTYDRSARGTCMRRQLAEPEDNVLFFAGEATEAIYYGTVHGAVKSGQRAADLVLESLRARQ
jgi:monoamine oxidase